MFIVKIFVSNKYQKMTLRHEKLPVHLMLASDAQGAQQLARQFLHVGAPFCGSTPHVYPLCLAYQEESVVFKRQH